MKISDNKTISLRHIGGQLEFHNKIGKEKIRQVRKRHDMTGQVMIG